MYKSKRGQFYLLAAVIMIALILGYVGYSNYSKKKNVIRLYNLGDQLEMESAKILEYGASSSFNQTQIESLLRGFTETYAEYSKIEKLYFIFGGTKNITVAGYHSTNPGTIQIDVGNFDVKDFYIKAGEFATEQFVPNGKIITIIVQNVDYGFELKPGENFYFVLIHTVGGEEYVITN